MSDEIREHVKQKYGRAALRVVTGETSCCSSTESCDPITSNLYAATETAELPREAVAASLGCGNPTALAELVAGETVLDLGSGGGIDVLLSAKRVGPTGKAYGLDMTDEMLALARENQRKAGVANVEFLEGEIEAIPLPDDSVDVVISNCVINLVPDKAAVYREVARVLRPGGRLIVSDIVLDAPLPAAIAESVAAFVGCIAGASLRADYLRTVADAGLVDIEVVSDRGFGEMALEMAPADLLRQADATGIDVRAVAGTVRSLTIRARKPGRGDTRMRTAAR